MSQKKRCCYDFAMNSAHLGVQYSTKSGGQSKAAQVAPGQPMGAQGAFQRKPKGAKREQRGNQRESRGNQEGRFVADPPISLCPRFLRKCSGKVFAGMCIDRVSAKSLLECLRQSVVFLFLPDPAKILGSGSALPERTGRRAARKAQVGGAPPHFEGGFKAFGVYLGGGGGVWALWALLVF